MTRFLVTTTLLLAAVATMAAPAQDASNPDRESLLRLHANVIRAHLESDVERLLADEADTYYVVSGRGEITWPTLAERRARLGAYLGRTRFDTYRDEVEPVVTISDDGTLGWVVVQIEARGTQKSDAGPDEPVQFVSSWIELYQKRDGRWQRVGNVSNFKP
ncbi:MAG TPA: hypothetical protein VF247_01280 [Candidatus Krumholzibacteria bacterium]